jgi:hypothetical protein
MNPFAKPEETIPYTFEEFPTPETEVTEFTGLEGIRDYFLKGFNPGDPAYSPSEDAVPVVQPVIWQDFREVIAAAQP